jgi:hypothetical protein
MKLRTKHSVLALTLLGAFGVAHATVLNPSSTTISVDQVAAPFGGTLLAQATTHISNASYNGLATAAVYETETGLDFYYQYANDISAINGLERFTGYDFSSLGATSVEVFQTDTAFGLFTAGTETSDYADRDGAGVIGFSFVPNSNSKINPGTTSFTQIVRTNARAFKAGNFGLLDGIGDNATGYGTVAVTTVPETETLAMMFVGLGLMGTIVSRRQKGEQLPGNFVA